MISIDRSGIVPGFPADIQNRRHKSSPHTHFLAVIESSRGFTQKSMYAFDVKVL